MGALKNEIYIGSLDNPTYYFDNDLILETPTSQAVALVGQELSIDTFSPIVKDRPENLMNIYHFRSSDGQEIQTGVGQIFAIDTEEGASSGIINIPDGTPMWYKNNGQLVGKFYVTTVDRLGKNKFRINSESAIGLLEHKYHGGGLFVASTFGAVLQHILASGLHGTGTAVIPYEIDSDVADLPVSGWLPYATKRNNLYQLIFAYGVNIIKNFDGNPRFTFVYTASNSAQEIPDDQIFYGGDVEYTKPYSAVDVVEHTYTAITDVEPTVLFDNTIGTQVFSEEIWFDSAPMIVSTLQTEGNLSLISATENSAIIAGTGILTGIPYTHTTRIVTKTNPLGTSGKVVNVSECTMVNIVNSQNLLNRLYAFYCPGTYIKKITNSLKYTNQRCGKAYRFHNPYMEEEAAFLARMDAQSTSFLRANCEFYANYEPAGQQGLFAHVVILEPEPDPENPEAKITEGDWEVPDGVTEFRVVLIGGGTGGGSGWPGQNGQDAQTHTDIETTADLSAVWFGAEGGAGGAGGAGGSPGRVKIVSVQNVVSGTTYHWSLGSGGEGGAATGFIPDTFDELKSALDSEDPGNVYTDEQINTMLAIEQELTDWNGAPNLGTTGTATEFGEWSTADQDASVPTGGIYEPITDQYFALAGETGIRGGNGGARKIESGGSFNWVTDGEDVIGEDGTVYYGGLTGNLLTTISGLPEAKLKAYGGNGAGAAVGIDRSTHEHINGGSDQEISWEVLEDEE